MTWHTASLVNNSGKAVSGNGSQKGDKGGAGVIEVQGYGEVVIRDKGWNDKYDAWAVQVGTTRRACCQR